MLPLSTHLFSHWPIPLTKTKVPLNLIKVCLNWDFSDSGIFFISAIPFHRELEGMIKYRGAILKP
jgi:hypothetical protein